MVIILVAFLPVKVGGNRREPAVLVASGGVVLVKRNAAIVVVSVKRVVAIITCNNAPGLGICGIAREALSG